MIALVRHLVRHTCKAHKNTKQCKSTTPDMNVVWNVPGQTDKTCDLGVLDKALKGRLGHSEAQQWSQL